MREKQFDLSVPLKGKTEDERRLERILMEEMVETGAHAVVPRYLTDYRQKMIRDKLLKSQGKWEDKA